MEVQEPSLLSDEAWQAISVEYEKVRGRFVNEYEQFLRMKYPEWIRGNWPKPVMSWEAVDYYLKDLTKKHKTVFIILCDGMRWDFWDILRQNLKEDFQITEEKICSLVPSTTSFSRRAIFSGALPEAFKDVLEQNALKKALGVDTIWAIGSRIDFGDLRELSKSTKKLRIFIYRTAEMLHKYFQTLNSALDGFKTASRELSQNLKYVVERANNPVVVITSDHGSTEVSEQLILPRQLYRKAQRKFIIKQDTTRCWIIGEKPNKIIKPHDIEDFKRQIRSEFSDRVFMFTPDNLALTRHDGIIVIAGEVVFKPFLVIIPRDYCYISSKTLAFAHGGLTPYETIIPFAILTPK